MSLKRTGYPNPDAGFRVTAGKSLLKKRVVSPITSETSAPEIVVAPFENTWMENSLTGGSQVVQPLTLGEELIVVEHNDPQTMMMMMEPTESTRKQNKHDDDLMMVEDKDNLEAIFDNLFETSLNTPEVMPEVEQPDEAGFFKEAEENNIMIVKTTQDTEDNGEVLFQGELPVVQQGQTELDAIWGQGMELGAPVVKKEENKPSALALNFEQKMKQVVDPMTCFNPFEVEGKSKKRKDLPKLHIPTATVTQNDESVGLLTPAVAQFLETNAATGFDLLDFVTNTELPVNDPSFLAMIGDGGTSENVQPQNESFNDFQTVNVQDISAVETENEEETLSESWSETATGQEELQKVKPVRKTRTAIDHTYNYASASSTCSTSASEAFSQQEDHKYRRMRDLNNLASKRCRQNRKRKFQAMVDEEDMLRKRNAELKMRCGHLEEMVAKLKKKFIERVSNPKPKKPKVEIDLDQLLNGI